MTELRCSQCGNDEQPTIAGWVYGGVYDGVSVWVCTKCGHEWRRFPDNEHINRALDAIDHKAEG